MRPTFEAADMQSVLCVAWRSRKSFSKFALGASCRLVLSVSLGNVLISTWLFVNGLYRDYMQNSAD